jgi:hypothetical protein
MIEGSGSRRSKNIWILGSGSATLSKNVIVIDKNSYDMVLGNSLNVPPPSFGECPVSECLMLEGCGAALSACPL